MNNNLNRNFLFIRHGQTDWGPNDILQGPLDLHLNEVGKNQAQNVFNIIEDECQCIVNPIIYSSPLNRAYETADTFAKNFLPSLLWRSYITLWTKSRTKIR